MKRRTSGLGTITQTPKGFRARGPLRPDGTRPALGVHPTRADAERALVEGLHALQRVRSKVEGETFHSFGCTVLDRRELAGCAVKQERARWKKHVSRAPFAGKALDKVTTGDMKEWVRKLQGTKASDSRATRKLARSTVQRCLALAKAIFVEAVEDERIERSPADVVYVKDDGRVTEEPWTFLTLEEQTSILTCEALPQETRDLLAFAWGSGLRQGEQWNLRLVDVDTEGKKPAVKVVYGSATKSTKSRKTRTVPLFGHALEAARRQVARLKGRQNDHGLLFPTVTGCRRPQGAPERSVRDPKTGKPGKVELLPEWLALAGITRHVRWHDLRHTCASALVSGMWGRLWTLEEVRPLMGHSSVKVTEIYAHLAGTALEKAAEETGHALVTRLAGGCSPIAAIVNDFEGVGRAGLEPATYGLKVPGIVELLRALKPKKEGRDQLVASLATTLADLLSQE